LFVSFWKEMRRKYGKEGKKLPEIWIPVLMAPQLPNHQGPNFKQLAFLPPSPYAGHTCVLRVVVFLVVFFFFESM